MSLAQKRLKKAQRKAKNKAFRKAENNRTISTHNCQLCGKTLKSGDFCYCWKGGGDDDYKPKKKQSWKKFIKPLLKQKYKT